MTWLLLVNTYNFFNKKNIKLKKNEKHTRSDGSYCFNIHHPKVNGG